MAQIFHAYDIQEEEMKTIQPLENNFYKIVQNIADKIAATRIGQFAIEQSDRVLQILEKTAKWSLPQDKQTTALQRPISWPLFLWLIVVLRLARFWLSIAAMLIGNNPVTVQDMVYFIQTRRRKLRAIRLQGIRTISEREIQANGRTSLLSKMSKTLLRAVCIKGNCAKTDQNILMLRQHWCNKSPASAMADKPQSTHKRACENEDEPVDIKKDKDLENDLHLSFEQKLSKYADMVSEDDSDFVPLVDDSTDDDDDDTSSSNSSAVSADNNENDEIIFASVLLDELKRLKELDGNENVDNGNQTIIKTEEERKMTPGHMSAAITEINPSSLLNNSAAVVTDVGEHESKRTHESMSSKTLNLPTHYSTYSATAAGTPVATETSLNTFESPTLGSASSSEDIFYSPIGSPTELDNMSQTFFSQQHAHKIVLPTIEIQGATPTKNDENIEPKIVQVVPQRPAQEPQQQEQHQKTQAHSKKSVNNHQYQHQNQHQHHQSQNQRYRGRNRRKLDAIP